MKKSSIKQIASNPKFNILPKNHMIWTKGGTDESEKSDGTDIIVDEIQY